MENYWFTKWEHYPWNKKINSKYYTIPVQGGTAFSGTLQIILADKNVFLDEKYRVLKTRKWLSLAKRIFWLVERNVIKNPRKQIHKKSDFN